MTIEPSEATESLLEEPTVEVDPLDGLHTTVVLQWAGNPPQYVLHVNSALDAENVNTFLAHELKRIAKALSKEPIRSEDATDLDVQRLAADLLAEE
jgi:hypothetical protein